MRSDTPLPTPEKPRPSDSDEQLDAYADALAAGDDAAKRRADCADEGAANEAAELEQDMACLRLIERARGFEHAQAIEKAFRPPDIDSQSDSSDSTDSSESLRPDHIGRFEIIREIGRGGSGVVFQARDPELGRDVALKVPHPEAVFQRDLRKRFVREAKAAALLTHPGIVPIFEVGRAGPISFIAAEYCECVSLAEWIDAQTGSVDERLAAAWVAEMADAVEHAHARGVLHRDLKPANVLMANVAPTHRADASIANRLHPRITDFGLAKLQRSDATATQDGAVLGTPSYMAPEQADAQFGDQGEATDVYGLGVILYELLAGRPPFREKTDIATLIAVRNREPKSLRRMRPTLSPDLAAICRKCLEKRPCDRYLSAGEMAADLRRYLSGRPTDARPLGVLRRTLKWARRDPAVAALVGVVLLSAASLAAGALWHAQRIAGESATNNTLRENAERREFEIGRARYLADMRLANRSLLDARPEAAKERLERYKPPSAHSIHRDFPWFYLRAKQNQTLKTFLEESRPYRTFTILPESKLLATSSDDSSVGFFDLKKKKPLAITMDCLAKVNALAITPDERSLIAGADGGALLVWDVTNVGEGVEPTRRARLDGHADDIHCLAVSPDGKWLASGGADNQILIWELATGRIVQTFSGHTNWVRDLDFSPDSESLVSISHDDFAILWKVQSGEEIGRVAVANGHPLGLAVRFHPSGRCFATGTSSGELSLFDARTFETLSKNVSFDNWIRTIDVSKDGNYLLAGGNEKHIRLFQIDGRFRVKPIQSFGGNGQRTLRVQFLNGSNTLVSSGADGSVLYRRIRNKNSKRTFQSPVASRSPVAAIVDRISIKIATTRDRDVVLFTAPDVGCLLNPRVSEHQTNLRWIYPKHSHGGVVSPGGEWLCVWADKLLRLSKVSEPHVWFDARFSDYIYAAAFCPNRNILATSDGSGEITLMEIPLMVRDVAWTPFEHVEAEDLLFTTDGRYLATRYGGAYDPQPATVVVWDFEQRVEYARIEGVRRLLAASPDGQSLLVVDMDQQPFIWDIASRAATLRFEGHTGRIFSGDFTPDGKYIATSAKTGPIKLWSLDTGELVVDMDEGLHHPRIVFTSNRSALAANLRFIRNNQDKGQLQYDIAELPGGASVLRKSLGAVSISQGLD